MKGQICRIRLSCGDLSTLRSRPESRRVEVATPVPNPRFQYRLWDDDGKDYSPLKVAQFPWQAHRLLMLILKGVLISVPMISEPFKAASFALRFHNILYGRQGPRRRRSLGHSQARDHTPVQHQRKSLSGRTCWQVRRSGAGRID